MKITVITPIYTIAGVPLAQVRFAKMLRDAGHDVTLVFCVSAGQGTGLSVPGLRIVSLGATRIFGAIPKIVSYLRRARPDVVFSAEDHLNYAVLLSLVISGVNSKVSCSSRVTPFDTYRGGLISKGMMLRVLGRLVMWRATVLTCVSRDMVDQYRQVLGSERHRSIYNVVVDDESRKRMFEPVSHPWLPVQDIPVIVGAGRLAHWKGFNYLIDAVALLATKRQVRLIILGDGPDRSALEQQVKSLGLEHCVSMPGYESNPLKYFRQASVFALSSTVEGMPNVLVEAMMCGCTPVATRCETGPRELLESVLPNHLATPRDARSLAEAIDYALEHPVEPSTLQKIIEPFTQQSVLKEHSNSLGLALTTG